jgi:acetyl-CoA acyltransferase 1
MESKTSTRLQVLSSHIAPNQTMNAGKVSPISDDDVVIVSMARTAMTKAKRGPQKDTAPEVMLSVVLKDVLQKVNVDPKLVEDVCIGSVL